MALVDAVRASLAGFAADHMVGQSRGWSTVPFELLSAEEAFVAVEDLQRGTTGEVISANAFFYGAALETYTQMALDQVKFHNGDLSIADITAAAGAE